MTQHPMSRLECPCCGCTAAIGIVHDGDSLGCGCAGWISLDRESPPEALLDEEMVCPPTARCQTPMTLPKRPWKCRWFGCLLQLQPIVLGVPGPYAKCPRCGRVMTRPSLGWDDEVQAP